jgi:hypothetical protein
MPLIAAHLNAAQRPPIHALKGRGPPGRKKRNIFSVFFPAPPFIPYSLSDKAIRS